jgi:hypothetical protein
MGLEGYRHGRCFARARRLHYLAEQPLVGKVNAIKIPDGQHGRRDLRTQLRQIVNRTHTR